MLAVRKVLSLGTAKVGLGLWAWWWCLGVLALSPSDKSHICVVALPLCSTAFEDVMSYPLLSGIFRGQEGTEQHTKSIIISAQRASLLPGEAVLHSPSKSC